MKAAVLHEPHQPLIIEEVDISNPKSREVLIRTAAVGVCHSDLHYIDGHYATPLPTVLGHEASGIVEKVGSEVNYVKPGDYVITCLSVFCGYCEFCVTGRPFSCANPKTARADHESPRLSQDGKVVHQFYDLSSFAEQMLIHEHALVRIRRDMPLDRAALIGCAVTTGVGAVVNTADIEVGATVAVIGCGGVGLSAINGAAIAGAGQIIAIDVADSKLEVARQFGATDTINSIDLDPVEMVRELTSGGVEYSFEALGTKPTSEQAFEMLRRSGVATIVGMVPEGQMIEIEGAELINDKRLQGSNMGSNRFRVDMPRYVDFYLRGQLKLDKMISKRIALENINEAFDDMKRGEIVRSVIVFNQE
ncbi:MAG: Zn-dependent alcohol dehydrogenase [Acidiferrobacterales bacterium]|nr:Zn-dependent alcohol dehydrogenase [Acidiferrobacterales bacterium]